LGVIFKIMPEDTGGALAVVEHPIDPGRLVRPHTHIKKEDEISYVIEGEIGVKVGDKEMEAGPGTWVFKPRGTPHAFWNAGTKVARLLEIITPGAFAHYFEELSAILAASVLPEMGKIEDLQRKWGQSLNMEMVPDIQAKYGPLKLVGDP
jgi:quercetin dioxygenase-like cupin family protein